MSVKVSETILYVRDTSTNELVPIGMVSSGANESLAQIKTEAEELLNSIPDDYTTMATQVATNTTDIAWLKQELAEIKASLTT